MNIYNIITLYAIFSLCIPVLIQSKSRQNDPVQTMIIRAMEDIESLFNNQKGRQHITLDRCDIPVAILLQTCEIYL